MPIDPRLIYDPSSIASQEQINYQRALAQMMVQKGMTPDQGGMAGQVYVGPSWTQGLARLLNAYGGNKMQQEAMGQQKELNINQARAIAAMINPQPQQPAYAPANYSLTNEPQAAAPSQSERYPAPPVGMQLRSLAQLPGGEESVKAWVADQTYTPEQKNARDPLIGEATRAGAWAPAYPAGASIRLGANGEASVNPALIQAEDLKQRATTGAQGSKTFELPGGAKVDLTPNEWEDYTRTGGLPRRYGGTAVAGPVGMTRTPEATKFAEGRAGTATDYEKSLNGRVEEGHASMLQLGEMSDALKQIRTGGGQEARTKLAGIAQAMGMPDKIINGIAGGDYAATQEFQKLASLSVLTQLRASLQGQGKVNRNEFDVFLKNSTNLETDPRAIEKLFAVRQRAYARDVLEQSAFNDYIDSGKNPANFPSYWASQIAPGGKPIAPGAAPGSKAPAAPAPKANPLEGLADELARRQKIGGVGGQW